MNSNRSTLESLLGERAAMTSPARKGRAPEEILRDLLGKGKHFELPESDPLPRRSSMRCEHLTKDGRQCRNSIPLSVGKAHCAIHQRVLRMGAASARFIGC